MTGLVCALSRERRRMLHEAPKLVHDISDRAVEVPGRVFFDALRLSRRLAARLPKAALVIVELLDGSLGEGIGEKGEWAFGRPHIVSGEDLVEVGRALDSLGLAARGDEAADDERRADDAFLATLGAMVAKERARGGALLVHVT
jgi:hypothetical protein